MMNQEMKNDDNQDVFWKMKLIYHDESKMKLIYQWKVEKWKTYMSGKSKMSAKSKMKEHDNSKICKLKMKI